VTGGAGSFESVSGGYYDKDTYTVSVPKTSISFMPEPGMFAEVRAKDMRIPDDGVEDLRAHWRMTVVGRSSPK